jgi:hypothetical protein
VGIGIFPGEIRKMATLEIQGESIEMETNGYSTKDYYASISFDTEESKDTEFCKTTDIPLKGDSRRDMTFEEIEKQINEYFEENYPDLEIVEFKRINIEERERIKQRPFDNYEF